MDNWELYNHALELTQTWNQPTPHLVEPYFSAAHHIEATTSAQGTLSLSFILSGEFECPWSVPLTEEPSENVAYWTGYNLRFQSKSVSIC